MIARRIYLLELTGRPTERLRMRYPHIAKKINDYVMCRTLNVLPRAGGLNDQWQEDIDYWHVFMQAESEVKRNA
jgi:hypothetical protein